MVVSVMLIGGGLGCWLRSTRIQRESVDAIQRAEGYVRYDWEYKGGEELENGGSPWPDWLVRLVGADFFSNVTVVYLDGIQSDRALQALKHFRHFENLFLEGAKINDRDLACLRERVASIDWT